MKSFSAFVVFLMILILTSCTKEEYTKFVYSDDEYIELTSSLDLPRDYDDFSVSIPDHLFLGQARRINGGKNPQATLGRVLFYDTRLSSSNTISCASCHKQEFAFADNKDFSDGVNNKITDRNSLALAAAPNLSASYESEVSTAAFGWDHKNQNSRVQSKAAILNQSEMGNFNIAEVIEKIQDLPEYRLLTRKAYGHESISEFEMLESLDAFMNSISAFNSKFDQGLSSAHGSVQREFLNFTPDENRGKSLFISHCASCHGEKHDIQMKQIANNGLNLEYADNGAGELLGIEFNGLFKVPFLRNIALTAPYMHDGRFKDLSDVIDHYSSQIQAHKNLSEELKSNDAPLRLNLSQSDKDALVAFLHTLTDENILNSDKHSNPFLE